MLEGGDNAAAIMNLPFSAQTIEAGLKSLGRTVDHARALSGRRRLRAAHLGQGQRAERWSAISPAISSRCAGCVDKTNRDEAIALLMNKRKLSRVARHAATT